MNIFAHSLIFQATGLGIGTSFNTICKIYYEIFCWQRKYNCPSRWSYFYIAMILLWAKYLGNSYIYFNISFDNNFAHNYATNIPYYIFYSFYYPRPLFKLWAYTWIGTSTQSNRFVWKYICINMVVEACVWWIYIHI